MAFTIRPSKANVQWIKTHFKQDVLKVEPAGLDRWTSEGGFVADEAKAKTRKIVFVTRKSAS